MVFRSGIYAPMGDSVPGEILQVGECDVGVSDEPQGREGRKSLRWRLPQGAWEVAAF
jgi:hypothetical protein